MHEGSLHGIWPYWPQIKCALSEVMKIWPAQQKEINITAAYCGKQCVPILWAIFTVFTRWRLWKGAVSEGKGYWFLGVLNSLPWLAGVCVTFPDLGLGAGHSLAVTVIHQSHGLVNDPSAGHDGSSLTWKPNQKELWTKPHPLINQNSKAWSSLLPLPDVLYQFGKKILLPTSAWPLYWHVLGCGCFGFFFRKATNLSPIITQLTVSQEQQVGLSPSSV